MAEKKEKPRCDIIVRFRFNNKISLPIIGKYLPYVPLVGRRFYSEIEFENSNDVKFSSSCSHDLQWHIESEKINIGQGGTSSAIYSDIYKKDINLEKIGDKTRVLVEYTPLVSGKYKLTISYAYADVDNAGKKDEIRFFDEYNQAYERNWSTLFEVYSGVYVIGVVSAILTLILSFVAVVKLVF